jgi:hypothetical protein
MERPDMADRRRNHNSYYLFTNLKSIPARDRGQAAEPQALVGQRLGFPRSGLAVMPRLCAFAVSSLRASSAEL